MWYPAVKDRKNSPIKFEDYVFLKTDDPALQEVNNLLGKRNFNSIKGLMKNEGALNALMGTPMSAFWKAKIASGSHPHQKTVPQLGTSFHFKVDRIKRATLDDRKDRTLEVIHYSFRILPALGRMKRCPIYFLEIKSKMEIAFNLWESFADLLR